MVAPAQAHDGCPESPAKLAAMRTCYRPLLVFSPDGHDARLREQISTLDSAADDMMDRNELLLPVLASSAGYQAPLDAPHRMLPAKEQARLRERFHVDSHRFRVLLLGEDGSVKLSSDTPITIERMNRLVDSMPTRKQEMLRRDSN
jgi:hypothetical protein